MLANWGEPTVVTRSRRAPRPARTFIVAVTATALGLPFSPALAQSVTATHTYDDAGRLKRSTYSDGKSVSYEYDAAGNRKSTAEGTPVQLSIAAASATEGGTLEHGAEEGFVLRFGEIGPDGNITIRSYGEGDAWRQTQALQGVWGAQVESVWQQNALEVIKQICTGSRIPKAQCN
jgi:YD repeat-containing protein